MTSKLKEIADFYYYQKNDPIMPDSVYDNLFKDEDDVVGSDLTPGFQKKKHRTEMLSIENIFSTDDLKKWYDPNTQYTIEPKIDGLALSLTYTNGVLTQALTRGDGEYGDDVTVNAFMISSILKEIPVKHPIEIRGEVFLTKDNFKKLGMGKTARNLAAGTLRLHDAQEVRRRNLSFIPYELIYDTLAGTWSECVDILSLWGFQVQEVTIVRLIDHLLNLVQSKKEYAYDTDGMVIKVNHLKKRVGKTAKFHKWQVAYKFQQEMVETKLTNVLWNVGRTGIVVPTAVFEPVEILGTTVQFASLHNFNIIEELGLRIGDTVLVQKCGEIIPHIMGISAQDSDGIDIDTPTNCPTCGSELAIHAREIVCENTSCGSRVLGWLENFVSKDAMDIKDISTSFLRTMYDSEKIQLPSDLYDLTPSDFIGLSGFGERSIERILQSIEDSVSVRLDKFINALSIPTIGKTMSKAIAEYFQDIDGLFYVLERNVGGIQNVPGISIGRYSEICHWIKENFEELYTLVNILDVLPMTGDFGKKVVLSGKMSLPRDEIEKFLESEGYEVCDHISKDVDLLIIGDKPGSKLEKAKKYGVEILTEEEFNKRITYGDD